MHTYRGMFLMVLLPLALTAQVARDVAPLKYWQAPLYWQPSEVESRAAARVEGFGNAVREGFANAAVRREAFGNAAREEGVGNSAIAALAPAQTPANSLVFVGMTPCRLVDTRAGFGFSGAFGPPSLVGGVTRTFPIQTSASCSIPSIAQAYSLNITVIPPGFLNYLTIWPLGSAQPTASTLNSYLGTVVANAAIVPAGNDVAGSLDVFVSNNTDLIIDINGYYAPQSGITLSQGSAGAPSLSFANDSSTGIFSSGAGNVNIATGGTTRLSVRSDGDIDLSGNIRFQGNPLLQIVKGVNGDFTDNIALGLGALQNNTTGTYNTAIGSGALKNHTTGFSNTAIGNSAMYFNTAGGQNTAIGVAAMQNNTTGGDNTAIGITALAGNTTGTDNTASGAGALDFNSVGSGNTADGSQALLSNISGSNNTASGRVAMGSNTTGNNNTAIGNIALGYNTTGNNNIAIGSNAAVFVSGGGSDNIHIGNLGVIGDNGTIKIGSVGTQSSFFAGGIRGITTGNNDAVAVVIDSHGQLGTVNSSKRFKEDIEDMGEASRNLMRLRPVTFRYQKPYADGSKPIQYGLIAEEVADVYPNLIAHSADGQIETVKYQVLGTMLLNEMQRQEGQIRADKDQIQELRQQISEQWERMAKLEAMLASMSNLPKAP